MVAEPTELKEVEKKQDTKKVPSVKFFMRTMTTNQEWLEAESSLRVYYADGWKIESIHNLGVVKNINPVTQTDQVGDKLLFVLVR